MERLCLFICCKYSGRIVREWFQFFMKVNFRSPQTDGHSSVPSILRSGGELFVRPSFFAPSCVLLHPSVCAQCHISPRVTVCPPNSNVGTPCGIHQHPHPPHRFLFLSHQPLLQHLQLRDFKLLKALLLLRSTTVSIRLKPVVKKKQRPFLSLWLSHLFRHYKRSQQLWSQVFSVFRLYNRLPFQTFNYQICVIQCWQEASKLQLNCFIYEHGRYLAGIISGVWACYRLVERWPRQDYYK